MGALALCTDGGGSIRNPAGFTNLCGLKPSFGRVPAYPPNLGFAGVDDEIARLIAAAAQLFGDLGAEVTEIDPPLGDCTDIFETHWRVGETGAGTSGQAA